MVPVLFGLTRRLCLTLPPVLSSLGVRPNQDAPRIFHRRPEGRRRSLPGNALPRILVLLRERLGVDLVNLLVQTATPADQLRSHAVGRRCQQRTLSFFTLVAPRKAMDAELLQMASQGADCLDPLPHE